MFGASACRKSGASKISPAEATPTVLVRPVRDAFEGLGDEGGGDGVDVLAACRGPAFDSAGAYDGVDEEGLVRAPAPVGGGRDRCVGRSKITDRLNGHVGGHVGDGQVLGNGDDVRHRELPDHLPDSHRFREGPLKDGRGVASALPLAAAVAQADVAAALAGDGTGPAGAGGGVPAAERVGDVGLVGCGPVAHRRGGRQVAEAAEEGHGRDDHRSRFPGPFPVLGEGVAVGLELGGNVPARREHAPDAARPALRADTGTFATDPSGRLRFGGGRSSGGCGAVR